MIKEILKEKSFEVKPNTSFEDFANCFMDGTLELGNYWTMLKVFKINKKLGSLK